MGLCGKFKKRFMIWFALQWRDAENVIFLLLKGMLFSYQFFEDKKILKFFFTGLYSNRLGQLTNSRIFSPLFPASYKNDGFCLCANTDAVTTQLHIWKWRQTRQVGVDLRRQTTINHVNALCDITNGWFLMQLSLLFISFVKWSKQVAQRPHSPDGCWLLMTNQRHRLLRGNIG